MKEEVINVYDELCTKKEYLRSGKDLSDIPMIMESIELKSDDEDIELLASEPERQVQSTQAPQKYQGKSRSLIDRIKIWVTTPLGVGWQETKHYRKKK